MEPDRESQTIFEMVQAVAGDADSLGRVLDRYRQRLTAVVIAAGVYQNVDDVVQEAMLKIVRAVRDGRVQLRSVDEFRGWTHAIARNSARDFLRRNKHQPRRLSSIFGHGGDDSEAGHADLIAGAEATPSVHARTKEELEGLRRQFAERCDRIAELRQPDQLLVWMRERDGLAFKAIALEFLNILGVSVGEDAIRVRYSRLCRDVIGPPLPDLPPANDPEVDDLC